MQSQQTLVGSVDIIDRLGALLGRANMAGVGRERAKKRGQNEYSPVGLNFCRKSSG